jgi:hypothetical protein
MARHPRESGESSTPRLIVSIADVSAILDRPLSLATTVGALQTRLRALAARFRASCAGNVPPSPNRGRRECRAPDAPAAACAMGVVERTRVSQVTPESPGIPRAMVYGLFISCSPRRGRLICLRRRQSCLHRLDAGTEASGPHDFAVRVRHLRQRHPFASTASRPALLTLRNAPLVGTGR